MTPREALAAIRLDRMPCLTCNKVHQPWDEKRGYAPTYKDRKDGHAYRPMKPWQLADRVLGGAA